MKKTISLIISMFLLLSSCGKIRELMNPTSDTSAQAKAAAEAQAKAAEAAAKAAIEPEIKTPSESETKSDETTEKQEEENEEELTVEIPLSLRVARWTAIKTIETAAIAAILYGGYKSIRHAIGEENWNSIMKRLRGGQQPAGQQNDNQQQQNDNQQPAGQQNQAAMDDDEYSSGGPYKPVQCLVRGEGLDNSIRNEKIVLDAKARGVAPPMVPANAVPREEGQAPRLVSKTGKIVKRNHEAQYKANWEVYKQEHYPGLHV